MTEQVVTLRIAATAAGVAPVVQGVRAEVDGASASTKTFGEVSVSAGRQAEAAYTGVGSAVARVAAAIGGVAAVKSFGNAFVEAADMQGRVEAQIQRVSASQAEYNAVLERTRSIADDAFFSINAISETFVNSIGPMRQLGRTTNDTLDLTEALSLSLVVSSASTDKQSTAISSLSKIMQTGRFEMDSFMSIVSTAPRFVEALESSLGKTRQELIEMVSAGTLTTSSLVSVTSQLGTLREEVAAMPTELVDAGVRFRNEFQAWAAATNQQLGLTQALVAGLDVLSNNIGPLVSTVTALATAWGVAYVGSLVAARIAAANKLAANVQLAASELAMAQAAEAAAAAQLSQTITLNQTRIATEALAAAQARTAAATGALNAAQVANIGLMSRAGAGLLALAGGPWGVAALAIGAVVAVTYNAIQAERERQAEFEATVSSTHAAADATDRYVASLSAIEGAMPPSVSSRLEEEARLIDVIAQRQEALTAARERYQKVLVAEIAIQNAMAMSGPGLADPGLAEQSENVKAAAAEVRSLELAIEHLRSKTEELAVANQESLLPVIETMITRYRELSVASNGGNWMDASRDFVERLAASYAAGSAEIEAMSTAYREAQGLAAQLAEAGKKANAELQTLGKNEAELARAQVAAFEERARASGSLTEEQIQARKLELQGFADSIAALGREKEAIKGKAQASREAERAQREQVRMLNEGLRAQTAFTTKLEDLRAEMGGPLAQAQLRHARDLALIAEQARIAGVSIDELTEAQERLDAQFSKNATKIAKDAAAAVKDAAKEMGRSWKDVLSEMNDTPFSRLLKDLELVRQGLEEATDPALVTQLEEAMSRLQGTMRSGLIDASIEALRGVQSLTQDGSNAFKGMQVAIDAMALVQGISAILNQGTGDPYSAPFRMAAMAAAIAPLIANLAGSIGSFGGSNGFTDTAAIRQERQGTGTVLGDALANSESILRASEITADATRELVGINRGMLRALIALQSGLDSAGGMLARGAGNAGFSELPAATRFGDVFMGGALSFARLDPLNLLGGSSRITDQGVVLMGDLLEGIILGAYQEVQSRSWRFGSRRTREEIVGVSGELESQFQLVIDSLVTTVREGALAIGLLPADIEAALASFRLAEIRISLKDLTAEEQQAELLAVFSSIFDSIAGTVVPFLPQFQRVGEGLGETLVRVATGVQVTEEALNRLGFSLDAVGPERFAQISEGLIGLVGGIEEFITGMSSFIDAFAPEAHQFALLQSDLNRAFAAAGMVVPETREGIWQLMQTLDATTESGREQIATLLRLSGTADAYYTMLERNQSEALRAAEEQAAALADYQALVAGLRDDLDVAGMSAFAIEMRNITRWADDARAELHATAQAAGLQAAAEEDLALVHQVAAQRAAAAIAALRASAADVVTNLFGTPLSQIEAEIRRIEEAQSSSYASQVQGIDAVGEAAQRVYAAQLSALQGIQAWLDAQLLGDTSSLTPEERLAEARRQFDTAAAAAAGGDVEALQRMTQLADMLLREEREYSASGPQFSQTEAYVRQRMAELAGMQLNAPNVGAGGGFSASAGASGGYVSPELQALYERRDAMLDEQLAAQREAMLAQLGGMVRELIQATGDPLEAVASSIGLNLHALAETVGINLQDASVETASGLADLARQLGVDVAELARNVGVELGTLAERQSLLNAALDQTLLSIPEEFRDQLAGPLNAIRTATTEADSTEAVRAAENAIRSMPGGIRDLLAPYFEGIGPAPLVSELTTLRDINANGVAQLDTLNGIRTAIEAIGRNIGVVEGEGVPSYDVGTAYVPRTGIALIHQGETILPAAVSAFARDQGITIGPAAAGSDSTAVVAELRALRTEHSNSQAQLVARLAALEDAQREGSTRIANEARRAADIAQQRGS